MWRHFLPRSIFIHIGRNESCKFFYGTRFNALKKEKKWQEASKIFSKSKECKKETGIWKKVLLQNKEERDHKKKYQQQVSEGRRNDSNLNEAKFQRAIKFGPRFYCLCCHCGVFEDGVKVFTDKMQDKILPYFGIFLYL